MNNMQSAQRQNNQLFFQPEGEGAVMVVDDSAVDRGLLRNILTTGGYAVIEAENGAIALKQLRSGVHVDVMLLDLIMPVMDGYEVLKELHSDDKLSELPVLISTASGSEETQIKVFELGASDCIVKPFNSRIILARVKNMLDRTRSQRLLVENISMKLHIEHQNRMLSLTDYDNLTGLYNVNTFAKKAAEIIRANKSGTLVISSFDVDNFKYVNDQYGRAVGDRMLIHIAETLNDVVNSAGGICAHIYADNFVAVYPRALVNSSALTAAHEAASTLDEPKIHVVLRIGIYEIKDFQLSVEDMIDMASTAREKIKGRYDVHTLMYDSSMSKPVEKKQYIVSQMVSALANGQFEVWLQPQYNHIKKERIGAEALVRWRHSTDGLISPGEFIPVFEENGFIYSLDRFVWEEVCKLLHRWADEGRYPLPLSINISRYDIFQPDFYDFLTGLVKKYNIPVELLHLEITESAFSKSSEQITEMVERLRNFGFNVEIDDFGSGYSSLNILKDVSANILKLDIRFLEANNRSNRGGRILESIVRMAKWLDMPVIAEGVETQKQADYLRTIGCTYIQGFLYAKPMPVSEYEKLPAVKSNARTGGLDTIGSIDKEKLWSPDSIETMVFNRLSGGACIFDYWDGHYEMIRVNDKFADTFNSTLTEPEILKIEPFAHLEESDRRNMIAALERAFESNEAETFEIHSFVYCERGKFEHVRFAVRIIESNDERYRFYGYVENVTAQRKAEAEMQRASNRLHTIMDSVDIGICAETVKKDGQLRLLFANKRYYDLCGCTELEFAEKYHDSFNIVHPDDRERVRKEIFEHYANDSERFIIKYRVQTASGDIVWLNSSSIVCSADGIDHVLMSSVSPSQH